jgi:diacylglycerol kinase
MFSKKIIVERLKSLVFASKGLWILVLKEDSFKYQLLSCLLAFLAGFYFEITKAEWLAQLGVMALILGLEGLNTAIEELANFVQPNQDEAIAKVKDLAAGAVLIAGLFALVMGLVIYIPYFIALF